MNRTTYLLLTVIRLIVLVLALSTLYKLSNDPVVRLCGFALLLALSFAASRMLRQRAHLS